MRLLTRKATSAAYFGSFIVNKPGINVYFNDRGVKLDSLGLDDDPIIEVKGDVRFEAAIVNLPDGTSGFRFELNFNGQRSLSWATLVRPQVSSFWTW